MSKIFFTVGKVTTQSIGSNQPVWALLPETRLPVVVPTYARQLSSGSRALFRLGSVRNFFNTQLLPHLRATAGKSIESTQRELASIQEQVDDFAADVPKRARIFLAYLSAHHLMDRKLYPIAEKLRQNGPLSSKDMTPLVEAVYTALRRTAAATSSYKQEIRDYIQSGAWDKTSIAWLARYVDPKFGLYLHKESLAHELKNPDGRNQALDPEALEQELRGAFEHIRAGGQCAEHACSIDLRAWLTTLIGCEPQAHFFAEIGESRQGLNKQSCLNFDASKSFQDFGEDAPRVLSLDKLSRAVTAFDRTLSHLVIAFANEDDEMKELCHNQPLHSGLLIRGLLGDCEAVKTLYPAHAMAIPNQPELSELLVAKTRAAYENGCFARACARHYGMAETDLANALSRTVAIQRRILPLVPIEVHRLADAIESRIRLRKTVEKHEAPSGKPLDRQQMTNLNLALQAQSLRHKQISKTLNADFRIDPNKMFYIDNILIDRIKALFGDELEFFRPLLADYIERSKSALGARNEPGNRGSVVNH
jgi:hypothetical protein